ncbi:MAG: HAD family phosphatase [Lachnospiraceae bacterium]|nr:HAD family phosphatase [Lachnospiraceae bacterium]
MLENIDAVLFDLDGTLVDSMWIWQEVDVAYLAGFGIPVPKGLQEDIGGMSFTEGAQYFKDRFKIPDTVEKIKEDWNRMAWDKYTHEVPLKKGAEEFVKYCRQNGIKMGIATSNSRELVENVMQVHGLSEYFDCIVTGCEVERGKPSPDIYLEAARRCKVTSEKCLVFEDIVDGIKAGKAAGMKVCAVDDKSSRASEKEKRKLADYYINDFSEIRREEHQF